MPINRNRIILVQTGTGAIAATIPGMEYAGLDRGVHYWDFIHTGRLEQLVEVENTQLLLIGLLGGKIEPVIELVRDLRRKNPRLVVILLDPTKIEQIPQIFDGHICKWDVDWMDQLATVIRKFDTGRLNHPVGPAEKI